MYKIHTLIILFKNYECENGFLEYVLDAELGNWWISDPHRDRISRPPVLNSYGTEKWPFSVPMRI